MVGPPVREVGGALGGAAFRVGELEAPTEPLECPLGQTDREFPSSNWNRKPNYSTGSMRKSLLAPPNTALSAIPSGVSMRRSTASTSRSTSPLGQATRRSST